MYDPAAEEGGGGPVMSKMKTTHKKRSIIKTERLVRIGDFLDERLNSDFRRRHYEAPLLEGRPRELVWYRIPIPEGTTGDGSEYHIYLKRGTNKNLCVFLSGGGVAWNEYTAARPTTGGKVAAGLPNYYWNNLRPFTQVYNIHQGMMQIGNLDNPFHDWNIVVITYATGDMHIGDADFPYTAEDGSEQILRFHGYRNFLAAMERAVKYFRKPRRLLIAGDSAGGFAVPALTPEILNTYYPGCEKVTVLSDSAQLLYRRWRSTARNVWKARPQFWEPLRGNNITLDWYRALYREMGEKLQYLYAGSPRDHLLSAYYNDVVNNEFRSDRAALEHFEKQMRNMVLQLKEVTPSFGVFVYPWRSPLHGGGTLHTAVRHPQFYLPTPDGVSMARWLGDAVEGRVYDANLDLLSIRERK